MSSSPLKTMLRICSPRFIVTMVAGFALMVLGAVTSPIVSAATSGSPQKGGSPSVPPQVEKINTSIAATWKDYSLKPSPMEDDLKWCRRVFLNILGRIPSFEEIQEFAKDKSPNRKQLLVDRLLNDDRYTEEYAANWSTIWANVLIGRNGGMEDRSLTNREGMLKYLRDCFARNRPYNDMVYELVTATGSSKPGTENFNGATNFLAMKVNEEEGVQATSAVSRTFLGLQVQCTQCHNHPFNEWKQQKFWEFNAFFRQTKSLRRFISGTRDVAHIELVDEDFSGESRRPDKADLFYQMRNGVTKVAYPVFVDGTAIDKSGYVQQINRRQELGKLMMQSPYMDKMIVNRMWAHFMTYGFTRPIDDLGPHNPSSNPELLEELGKEFRNSSYDLKQLMTWIVLSDPYQRSSRITADNVTDDPTVGEPPRFTHFYAKQMRAEELYQSLVVATQADRKGSLEEQEQRRSNWLRQFVVAFGTDEGDETSTFNGSIPQSLMMFNGDLMKEATSLEAGSWLQRISTTAAPAAEKVQYLFAAGLARKAKPEELNTAKSLLDARKNDTAAMLQDLWWAILNSNEFIINH
ncbi:MAG: DUF1549 domain-containing protein [Planctomycetota bacterium]|nr:DUF1549 domain-containing protein [Planctomycetota bacterium]